MKGKGLQETAVWCLWVSAQLSRRLSILQIGLQTRPGAVSLNKEPIISILSFPNIQLWDTILPGVGEVQSLKVQEILLWLSSSSQDFLLPTHLDPPLQFSMGGVVWGWNGTPIGCCWKKEGGLGHTPRGGHKPELGLIGRWKINYCYLMKGLDLGRSNWEGPGVCWRGWGTKANAFYTFQSFNKYCRIEWSPFSLWNIRVTIRECQRECFVLNYLRLLDSNLPIRIVFHPLGIWEHINPFYLDVWLKITNKRLFGLKHRETNTYLTFYLILPYFIFATVPVGHYRHIFWMRKLRRLFIIAECNWKWCLQTQIHA